MLLSLQFGLMAGYASYDDRVNVGTEEIVDDYDRYVGEKVVFDGVLVSVDPYVLRDEYLPGEHVEVELVGIDRRLDRGSQIGVYGELLPGKRVDVEKFVVHPPGNLRYMYGVSILALGLALAALLKYWRPEPGDFVLRRRE